MQLPELANVSSVANSPPTKHLHHRITLANDGYRHCFGKIGTLVRVMGNLMKVTHGGEMLHQTGFTTSTNAPRETITILT